MSIYLKTEDEIELIRRAGKIASATLKELSKHIEAGVSTLKLDRIAEEFIKDNGASPAFKNFFNPSQGVFPCSICTSVNDVVAHGIPSSNEILYPGDIISIDCGVTFDGFNADTSYTFSVEKISKEAEKLILSTRKALDLGIKSIEIGSRIGDIAYTIESFSKSQGLNIIEQYLGHGIGRSLHEDPFLPSRGHFHQGKMIKPGMVLSIEPALTKGKGTICIMPNGWSLRTSDSTLAAHFEQTIAVRRDGIEILTIF